DLLQLHTQIFSMSKKKWPKRITGFQFCPIDSRKVIVSSADSRVCQQEHKRFDKFFPSTREDSSSLAPLLDPLLHHAKECVTELRYSKLLRAIHTKKVTEMHADKNIELNYGQKELVVVRADLNEHLKAIIDYFLLAKGEPSADTRLPPRQSTAEAGIMVPFRLVALGEMAELLNVDHNADKLTQGMLSTKGVGATAPNLSEAVTHEDGVFLTLGQPKQQLKMVPKLLSFLLIPQDFVEENLI
ncbi:hypothetical protein Tco_1151261, partial [Tanacetum coccineum]